MKKLLFVLFVLFVLFNVTSCSKKIETYNESNGKIYSANFFDTELIATAKLNDIDYAIYREKNSDVLYVGYPRFGIVSVIMEPDGTPLTYSEWLSRR